MKTRILYIENNEPNLYMVSFLLKAKGYEMIQARDGSTGIEAARLKLPDLILLDIQLPGMDGYEIVRLLRQNLELSETPIIALTSFAMAGDRERALTAGCTGYIEKPINPDTFVLEVGRYLSKCTSKGTDE